jgi:hypothetical protein
LVLLIYVPFLCYFEAFAWIRNLALNCKMILPQFFFYLDVHYLIFGYNQLSICHSHAHAVLAGEVKKMGSGTFDLNEQPHENRGMRVIDNCQFLTLL